MASRTPATAGDDFDRRGGGPREGVDRSGRQADRGPEGRGQERRLRRHVLHHGARRGGFPLDEVVEDKGVKLLIDPKAVFFLLGSEMDFRVDRLSATFSFRNPNETSACGCGESVAITPASPEALNAPA